MNSPFKPCTHDPVSKHVEWKNLDTEDHALYVVIYEGQEQTKLTHSYRNQNGSFFGGDSDWAEHEGTFWNEGNVSSLDLSGGCMGEAHLRSV